MKNAIDWVGIRAFVQNDARAELLDRIAHLEKALHCIVDVVQNNQNVDFVSYSLNLKNAITHAQNVLENKQKQPTKEIK